MNLFSKKIVSLIGLILSGTGCLTYLKISGSNHLIPSLTFSSDKLNLSLDSPKTPNELKLSPPDLSELNVGSFTTLEGNVQTLNYDKQAIDLSNHASLNKELEPNIRNTFKEMKKELKVKELEKKSLEKIKHIGTNLNNEDTQTVIRVAQKYRDYNSSVTPRRIKRGAERTLTDDTKKEKPVLNDKERKSLSKYYSQFVNLNDFKTNLELELNSFSDDPVKLAQEEKIDENAEKLREGVISLKSIRWDYPNLKLFGGQYGDQRRDTLDPQRVRSWRNIECQDEYCGWSNWRDNPYRNFFKNEWEWKKFISEITNPQKKIVENIDNPRRIVCTLLFFPGVENFVSYYGMLWFIRKAYIWKNGPELKRLNEGDCGVKEQDLLFKNISEAKNNLQFKISSALLERMKLLSN